MQYSHSVHHVTLVSHTFVSNACIYVTEHFVTQALLFLHVHFRSQIELNWHLLLLPSGDVDALQQLRVDLLQKCQEIKRGYLLVHAAAESGHAECITALARLGGGGTFAATTHPDPNRTEGGTGFAGGFTAVDLAVDEDQPACLQALAAAGAVGTFLFKSDSGRSPIHNAAEMGHKDCLRVLCEHLPPHVQLTAMTSTDVFRRNPAHLAALFDNADCLQVMWEKLPESVVSAAMKARDCEKNTPAILAVFNDSAGCLSIIVQAAADAVTIAGGPDEAPPACYAAEVGYVDCLKAIGQGGKEAVNSFFMTNKDGDTPAILAADQGHYLCLEVLSQSCVGDGQIQVLVQDNQGNTPAHAAAGKGHPLCLEVIVARGAAASLSAVDSENHTPAILAADNGHSECLKIIAKEGA